MDDFLNFIKIMFLLYRDWKLNIVRVVRSFSKYISYEGPIWYRLKNDYIQGNSQKIIKRENKVDKNGKIIAKTDDSWSLKYVRRKKDSQLVPLHRIPSEFPPLFVRLSYSFKCKIANTSNTSLSFYFTSTQ